jgi:periplasmic protein TonB
MFDQTFVDGVGRTNKTWTVLASFGVQTTAAMVAVIIPLFFTDALPKAHWTQIYMAPPDPPPPVPPGESTPIKVAKMIPRQFDEGKLRQPHSIPSDIALIKEEDLPPPSSPPGVGCITGGVPGGIPGGLSVGIIETMPPKVVSPPPVKIEEKKPVATPRVRVGGVVQAAKVIRAPKPAYPPLARQARIQGVVHLNAVIGKDGTIQDLKAAGGHPLLVPAALEAVRQWVYKPTLLNDEPVEVVTVIDVNFTISQ